MTGFYTQGVPDLESFSGPVQPESTITERGAAFSLGAMDTLGAYAHGAAEMFSDKPYLSPEDANKKYGIGDLKFDHPVREDDADFMHQAKVSEMQRADVLNRTPDGWGPKIANFGLGMSLDPLNSAAMLLPELGGARLARFAFGVKDVGQLGLAARTGARVVAGGVNNAVAQTGMDAIRLGGAAISGQDFTPADAITDIGAGALWGGVLDGGFHGVGDILSGKFHGSLEGHLTNTDPTTADAALRASIAQMQEGRPVDVDAILKNDLRGRLMSTSSLSLPEPVQGLNLEEGMPRVGVPVMQGETPLMFTDPDLAALRVEKLKDQGISARPMRTEDGSYALMQDASGDIARDESGNPQVFDNLKAANKFRTRLNDQTGEPAHVVELPGDKGFVVTRNMKPEDIAAIKAQPDLFAQSVTEHNAARQALAQQEVARMMRETPAAASAVQFASGKLDPVIQQTVDRSRTLRDTARAPEQRLQLAKDMGDTYERGLLQAHAEGRLSDTDLEEVRAVNQMVADTEGTLEKYDSLAACMTQEVA